MLLRAILFDYGGTLDGGVHWLERFAQLYRAAGLDVPFDRLRTAFDHATHRAYSDAAVADLDLEELVRYHVTQQAEYLGISAAVGSVIVTDFVRASRAGLEESRRLLLRLREHVALGVISNFYGNLHHILERAGVAPLLSTIIDSAVVGLKKPDPEIFTLAVRRLVCDPGEALYVGDSFEKDMVGAHTAGLRTAWLVGPIERPCRFPECVDLRLRRLADLEAAVAAWHGHTSQASPRHG